MYALILTILFGANASASVSVENIQTLALCEEAAATHTARMKKAGAFVTTITSCVKTSEK
jgi:hypothetical protein